ncbi:MAG: hypothetical protein GC147_00665 [Porphyrobacter sp.]|nr:hypothetical protein [Porphyrobacter sp.]
MRRDKQERRSFLQSLLNDVTANTIAICAAALIPLVAMIGGGVDASRYYMTASRMQAACDAGALAARRAMTDDTFTAEHRQIGLNFFDQNFSQGMFGVENGTRDYTSDGEGVVTGTASGVLPTSLMGAFGFNSFNISVTCSAEINISNSDIMFVLDVTGSMADCPDGTRCNSGAGSKIVALRDAVMNFYDTVEAATSASAQIRYGVVPYSQQVNVGFSIPTQYMASRNTYQSRVAMFKDEPYLEGEGGVKVGDMTVYSDQDEWLPRSTSDFGSTNWDNYRFRNRNNHPTRPNSTDSTRCSNMTGRTYTVGNEVWEVMSSSYVLGAFSWGDMTWRAACYGRVRKTRPAQVSDLVNPVTKYRQVFDKYRYCPVDTDDATPCDVNNPAGSPAGWETVDLSTLYDDNQIDLPTGSQGAMQTHTWDGCIEEPSTVQTDNYSPIPPNAYDLNINLVPTSEEQKWKPALRNAVWKREDGSGNQLGWLEQDWDENRPGYTCPRAAFRLREIPRADLQTYVNSLNASGNTYHDIGMLWGARFISPRGLFAADNITAPNGDAIARHIVFMTDGEQVNNVENYSTHGIEWWDRRITGDGNSSREFNRRASRLQAICRAARQENITVWVVAFGTTLTQNLIDCASPGRAFQANDSATLNARFQEIAQKIAALRLTS